MRGLVCFLVALGIPHLNGTHAAKHIPVSPRGVNAGGAIICYKSPAISSSPEYSLCHDICANDATTCLSQRDLEVQIVGGGDPNSFLNSISPYEGGHCLIYATADCTDNTAMPLMNPNHLDLKFPK